MSQEQRRPDAGLRAEVQTSGPQTSVPTADSQHLPHLPPWPHCPQSEGAQLNVKRLPASQGHKPACPWCPHTFSSWILVSPFLLS